MKFILPFAAIGRGMLPMVGGKAANLGELVVAGFPVPAGFCVTTAAYDLVQDFQVGVDKLDLRALNTSGSSTFTRQTFGGSTFVYVDQDGNGTQDFLVVATGVTLTDADIRWTAASAPEARKVAARRFASPPPGARCIRPRLFPPAWL